MSWFNPPDPGYGTGFPYRWQGWLTLGLFFGTIALLTWQLHHRPVLLIAIILILLVGFTLLARAKTRGGWKWRNSKKDR